MADNRAHLLSADRVSQAGRHLRLAIGEPECGIFSRAIVISHSAPGGALGFLDSATFSAAGFLGALV